MKKIKRLKHTKKHLIRRKEGVTQHYWIGKKQKSKKINVFKSVNNYRNRSVRMRKVFFSFKHEGDVSRAMVVRNIWETINRRKNNKFN